MAALSMLALVWVAGDAFASMARAAPVNDASVLLDGAARSADGVGGARDQEEALLIQLSGSRQDRPVKQPKVSLAEFRQQASYWLESHSRYAWENYRREELAEKRAMNKVEQLDQTKARAATHLAEEEKIAALAVLTDAQKETAAALTEVKYAAGANKAKARARVEAARVMEAKANLTWTEKKNVWLSKLRIPHILHRVLFASETTGHGNCEKKQWAGYRALFREKNPGWQEWVWTEPDIHRLLERQERELFSDPRLHGFSEIFENLKPWVKKKDVAPYFILHAFGGVFMDHDMECVRPLEDILGGADLVLRQKFKVNFMASAPGQNLWPEMLAQIANVTKFGWRSKAAAELGPIRHTGQYPLADTYKRLVEEGHNFEGLRIVGLDQIDNTNTTSGNGTASLCVHHPWALWADEWYGGGYIKGNQVRVPQVCRNFTREDGMRNLLCDCPSLFTGAVYGKDLREVAHL